MSKRIHHRLSSDSGIGPESQSDSDSESGSDSGCRPFDPAATATRKLARPSPAPQQHIIQCTLPPHCIRSPQSFASYPAFERHYATAHALVCVSCARSFPSQHYLDLHFDEFHDPFVAARRDRHEKVYRCFVEDCDKVCADTRKRRLHLIDKHGFPKEFMFAVVAHGLSPDQTSLLYPQKKSRYIRNSPNNNTDNDDNNDTGDDAPPGERNLTTTTTANDDDGEPEIDSDLVAVERQFRGITLVPDKIRFGRKRGS
ncbi:hypothetical protein V1525DRAFT_396454 [Lipomyces kononenkoae]|uniref:Uncharacterized protein n=1 Tax=Lipomyces kononenkoae TaxID=34357 RepID=A0ACC3T8L9_LIPKO